MWGVQCGALNERGVWTGAWCERCVMWGVLSVRGV